MSDFIKNSFYDTRVFVEKYDPDQAWFTGVLVEVPLVHSVDWSVSASGSKSASVSLSNPAEVFTRSVRHDDLRGVSKETTPDLTSYIKEVCDKYIGMSGPLSETQVHDSSTVERSAAAFLAEDFCYKAPEISAYTTAVLAGVSFSLMQRIWIVTRCDGAANTGDYPRRRYSVWAGIIQTLSDTAEYEGGELSLTISCVGLSRLLELVTISQHFRLSFYKGTILEKFGQVIADKVFNARGYDQFFDLISNLPAAGFAAFPAYLTNFFLTSCGFSGGEGDDNDGEGYEALSVPSLLEDKYRYSQYFSYTEPIWTFGDVELGVTWEDVLSGKDSFVAKRNFASNDILEKLMGVRNVGDSEDPFEFPVTVADMLPSVYVDPLIIYMWSNQTALSITQNLIKQQWSITDTASYTAADFFKEGAKALFANAYEDDFGNLIIEVPRYWCLPPVGERRNVFSISSYSSDFKDRRVPLDDRYLTEDSIIPDIDVLKNSRTFSETNIISAVEVPSAWAITELADEFIKETSFVGRTRADDPDILDLQRRYGLRIEAISPLWLNKSLAGFKDKDTFLKSLDGFAIGILQLRNISAVANTITLLPQPWLPVGHNLLLLYDESLAFLVSKSFAWSAESEPSFTCTCAMRHKITQRVGYPLYDAFRPILLKED